MSPLASGRRRGSILALAVLAAGTAFAWPNRRVLGGAVVASLGLPTTVAAEDRESFNLGDGEVDEKWRWMRNDEMAKKKIGRAHV